MLEPYYNTYQKEDYKRLLAYKEMVDYHTKNRNVFVSCGLKDAAERAGEQIGKAQRAYNQLAEKMMHDRDEMAAAMVKVFLICYLAYAKALDFEDLVKKLTGTKESDLSYDCHKMVKVCEELALAIDNFGLKQAYAFGDITDILEQKYAEILEPAVDEIIEDFKNSEEFKRFF